MNGTGQTIHPRSTHKPALHFVCMSDYERQVKLAAKGLAERDNSPMSNAVTTPEEFYEVMAAAVLDAIDLPALLERVAKAERELEIVREALSLADAAAKNARHKPMINGEAPEESSITSILSGADAGRGPRGTQNPRPISLPNNPEHNDPVGEQRRVPEAPPRLNRSRQTKPPPRRPPNRKGRASRRALVNHLSLFVWRRLLPPRSPLRRAGT